MSLIWLLLAASVSPAATPSAHGLGDLDLVSAIEALDRGDPRSALALGSHLLAGPCTREMRAEVRLVTARAALEAGELERALDLVSGVEADLPEVADLVLDYRARALAGLGRWEEALPWWRDLVARWGDSPLAGAARYSVADALYALGKPKEAEPAYTAALRAAPRSSREPAARLTLARIAEQQGRWVDAAAGYAYLAYYRPGNPSAAAAQERLEELVKKGHAKPPTLQQQLARLDVLLSARDLDEAGRALEAAARLAGSSDQSALAARRAKLAYARRDFAAAAEAFTALARQARGYDRLEYQQWLARTYSTQGDYDRAIEVYLGIADEWRSRGDGREALYKAAWLAYHAGDSRRAVTLFGRFLERFPKDGSADEALWFLAWNAFKLGDLPAATSSLVRLRREHPDSSLVQRTYYWQGRMAELLADPEGARDSFAQALASEPLGYYGVLAAQRLRELRIESSPALASTDTRLAADTGTALVGSSPEPGREDLPLLGDPHLAREDPGPPWGAAVLDWQSDGGRRVLRLARLGLRELASDALAKVRPVPGFEAAQVVYGRARLLASLGDYNAAYRLVELGFGDAMRAGPGTAARRLFQLAYPDAHAALVTQAAREFSVSPLLILAVMRQESGFDEGARSGASAHGLMQIIGPTADRIASALDVDDYDDTRLRTPEVNVRFGGWYLAELMKKFGGNPVLALASYNAGPTAVESWVDASAGRPLDEFVEDIPFRETRFYVKRVLGNLAVYAWLHGRRVLTLPEVVPGKYLDNVDF